MKSNMGLADRIIRMSIAVVIVVLYSFNIIEGTLAIVALVLALIFTVTSVVKFCPLYLPFGISTRTRKNVKKEIPTA